MIERPRLLLVLAISSMILLPMHIPPVKAATTLYLDGTGTACNNATTNSTYLQGQGCSPGSVGSPLCADHAGQFCPAGDLVVLQILLNNTGTVTKVQGTRGLEQWYQRASVLNGLGGRMEEWYATSTETIANPVIYITETVSGITIAAQEFAIAGYDTDAPFDPNTMVPASYTGSSGTISALISTSHPDDLLLGLEYGGSGTLGAATGFTGVCLDLGPCQFTGIAPNGSEYMSATDVKSSFLISMTQTGAASWGFIVDAVKAGSPAISSVSPNVGITGSQVAIKGISLNDTIDVRFCGDSQPSFVVVNDTMITTVVPQLSNPPSTQTCDIVITTKEGSSATLTSDRFSFLPDVLTVTPTSGGVGTAIVIRGSSFIGATSVTICSVAQPRITVTNDTQILTTIPVIAIANSTRCNVSVTNPNGGSDATEVSKFTFLPQTRVAPTSIPPLFSGRILFFASLTLVAVALLFGSRMIRRRDTVDNTPG